MDTEFSQDIYEFIEKFVESTATAWMETGLVTANSYGVVLLAGEPGQDFREVQSFEFGASLGGAAHDTVWYRLNALGKAAVCKTTGLDSAEAVKLRPGVISRMEGAFPWGGAVVDHDYGLIVGTSGFKEDEDILFSKAILHFVVMMMDREGDAMLEEARTRGNQTSNAGADRFTRL
jgi:hypothetical protein